MSKFLPDIVSPDSPAHDYLERIRAKIVRPVHAQTVTHVVKGQAKSLIHTFPQKLWKKWPHLEILLFTDLQYGHDCCIEEKVIEYRDWMLAEEYRYCMWGGDMVDAWRVGSPGAGYDNLFSPENQLYRFCELAAPIVHRTLGFVGGNHERRSLAGGVDLGGLISFALGVPFSAGVQLSQINYGAWSGDRPFKTHLWHGSGGATTAGAKVNKALKATANADANVYFSGHIHTAFVYPLTHNRIVPGGSVEKEDAFAVSASSFMEWWGSYAEVMGCGRNPLSMPLVRVFADGRFDVVLHGNNGRV